jgi:hypothetical protein
MSCTGFALPPIRIISVEDIMQLPLSLARKQKYFTLLLAWDLADPNDPDLKTALRQLVSQGLTYLSAWGRNCEAVHDAADEACLDLGVGLGEEDYLCVTTWHSDEPLHEAYWFFSNLAVPAEPYVFSDFERFAVAVGDSKWAIRMEEFNRQS